MKKLIFLLLFPLCLTAQFRAYENEEFAFFSTAIDARNAIEQGYDGKFNIGYRAQWFQVHGSLEIYPTRKYTFYGAGFGYVHNYSRKWDYVLSFEAGLIYRGLEENQRYHDPSLAITGQINYNMGRWFLFALAEVRNRPDLYRYGDHIRFSGFLGIGIKIFN